MPSSSASTSSCGRLDAARGRRAAAPARAGSAASCAPTARPLTSEQRGGHHDDRPPGPAGRRRRPPGRRSAARRIGCRAVGRPHGRLRRQVRDEQVPPALALGRQRDPAPAATIATSTTADDGDADGDAVAAARRVPTAPPSPPPTWVETLPKPARPTGSLRAVVSRASPRASERSGSEPRSYVVRTFGCQMNEHDSERIAGLLEADGHGARPTIVGRRRRRRAQHVLHPRERRQQAVRQPRPPQDVEGASATAARSSCPAAWPRRTATSCASGPATSTS